MTHFDIIHETRRSVNISTLPNTQEIGIETAEEWYWCKHEHITVLWKRGVQTYREVQVNRPDKIITNKTAKIFLLIDVVIRSDRNEIKKEAENKLIHKNLSTEIQWMWNMKCFIIPRITEPNGIITKGRKNIWKRYQESIQYIPHKKKKKPLLGISHIIREVLQYETWCPSCWLHHWFNGWSTRGKETCDKRCWWWWWWYT